MTRGQDCQSMGKFCSIIGHLALIVNLEKKKNKKKDDNQRITVVMMSLRQQKNIDVPHGVSDVSMFRDPKQFVRPGDGVEVRAQAIVEISVWLPDLLQHLDVEAQVVDGERVGVLVQTGEAEALVAPVLAEVAVHRIIL